MSISRIRAQDYAEQVLNRPGGEKRVTLWHHKNGTTLLHNRRALTRTYASGAGRLQAEFVAQVLGVGLPAVDEWIQVTVPSGVLYRAVAVSSLDLRRQEARVVLAQILNTASMQRGAFNTIEVG